MEILGFEKVSFVDSEGKICATVFAGGCNLRCPFCHNSGIVEKCFSSHREDEVFAYLEKRKSLLDSVVISGGEPTLQHDLESFVKKIKEMGYLVKLDTNGTCPKVLKNLFGKNLIDYVAMDIKNNFSDYAGLVGVNNFQVDNIKESLNLLKEYNVQYEF